MNKKQFRHLEKALHRACKQHLSNGGTLIRGGYWTDEMHCCPIRATITWNDTRSFFDRILYKQIVPFTFPKDKSYSTALGDAVGFSISDQEMNYFIRGYDSACAGYPDPIDDDGKALFNLGKKFADQYQPEKMQ